MDKKLANLQNLQPLHTRTRTRVSYNATPNAKDENSLDAASTNTAGTLSHPVAEKAVPISLPLFPDYSRPVFLQKMIDCGNSPAQHLPPGKSEMEHPWERKRQTPPNAESW